MMQIESDGRVEFDPASHTYVDDRGEVPSVTDVVRWWTGQRWHGAHDEYAADRGHRVHTAIALASHDLLDESKVENDIAPYLMGWRRFVLDSGWRSWATEVVVYNSVFRYAGTIDAVGAIAEGRMTVLDWKSGSFANWHPVQVGLYAAALADRYGLSIEAIDTLDVYLTRVGTYTCRPGGLLYVHEGKRAVASWWRDVGPRKDGGRRIDEARNIDAAEAVPGSSVGWRRWRDGAACGHRGVQAGRRRARVPDEGRALDRPCEAV
jgi:hypothetical protein